MLRRVLGALVLSFVVANGYHLFVAGLRYAMSWLSHRRSRFVVDPSLWGRFAASLDGRF